VKEEVKLDNENEVTSPAQKDGFKSKFFKKSKKADKGKEKKDKKADKGKAAVADKSSTAKKDTKSKTNASDKSAASKQLGDNDQIS